jgi:hypothetical protein
MRLALYQGVDHIERFGQGRKAKKPAAGEEVILIALIFIEILRKKQGPSGNSTSMRTRQVGTRAGFVWRRCRRE